MSISSPNRKSPESSFGDFKQTTWTNPTLDRAKIKIWVGPETAPNPWRLLEIPPGGEITIPSEFDAAIHQVDKDGVVVGGLGPLLRKKGDDSYKLNPALDTNLAERTAALMLAQEALDQKRAVESTAVMAQEFIKLAEAKKAATRELEEKIASEQKAAREAAQATHAEKAKK